MPSNMRRMRASRRASRSVMRRSGPGYPVSITPDAPWATTRPRRLALRPAVEANGGRIHDSLADPLGPTVIGAIAELRRRKDPDELDVLRACMRATEAGHAWARQNIRAGMTELDVYEGVFATCSTAAG